MKEFTYEEITLIRKSLNELGRKTFKELEEEYNLDNEELEERYNKINELYDKFLEEEERLEEEKESECE